MAGKGKGRAGLALGALGLAALGVAVWAIVTITGGVASPQTAQAACSGAEGAAPAAPDRATLGLLVEIVPPCPVAAFSFQGPDGQPLSLADFRGKAVLVNLWATWCPPCLREMPALDALQKQKGGPDFAVVAISQDLGGQEVARSWLASKGLDLAPYADPAGAAARALRAPGLPVSVLIDPEGREIARLTGEADWNSPEMVARLKALTAPPG